MGNSKLIKHFVAGISALLLAGCVTYYPYPERVYSASDNSTQYYGRGNDSQEYDSADDVTVVYGSTFYYPWWSVDYFYLGNHYYRPSLSFSFSYGSPWYSPYHAYYGYPHYHSPWYPAFYGYPYAYYGPRAWWGIGFGFGYGYGYGWNDPYWYHRYRGYDHYRYGHHYGRGYAGYQDHHLRNVSRRDGQYVDRYDRGERTRTWNRDYRAVDQRRRDLQTQVSTDRRISVTPAGAESDRGMVVVNRSDAKPRENRLQPIVSAERQGEAIVLEPGKSPATRTVQQGSMRVVQPGLNKQGQSRTGMPVESIPAHPGPEVVVNQSSQLLNQPRSTQPRANQSVVRMPAPERRASTTSTSPSNNRESHGSGSRELRGEHGGRGRRDRS